MRRLVALVALACAGCITPPPPLRIPPPLPQLPPVSPAGFRPLPSAVIIQPCHPRLDGSPRRCIIWGEASNGSWYMGPYDPAYAPAFCNFNPSRGDVYRSEANGLVLTAPEGCPS